MNTRNFRTLKPELLAKFNNQCAYCGTKLYDPLMADVEHFYPKSLYPHLMQDVDNLLIACRACNMIKSNKFPIDEDGNPLLINPATEKYSDHIARLDNGYLEGLTERGRETISVLQLNRPSLVEQRVLDVIEMKFADDSKLSERDVYMTFKDSMQKVIALNSVDLSSGDNLQGYMAYILYANVITALETYLCDRFVALVQSDKSYLRSFVENFHDYKNEKFSLSELFVKHDEIESKTINSMKDVLYHNMPKVSGMYRDTFGIQFPKFSDVFKSVKIRHDLVHRGGKTRDGDFHNLNGESVTEVSNECLGFVEQLEKELREIK